MADSAGRISKATFVGTSSTFLAICIISSAVRFFIRFRIQKEFGWDDGFLIFGLFCLITSIGLLQPVMDTMYEAEGLVFGEINPLTFDLVTFIPKSVRYRKLSAAALILIWCSISCVKFSFLAFIRKLVRRMPSMERYWWFTLAFNVAVTIYGTAVYIVACPYFTEAEAMKSMQCVQGSGLAIALSHSIAQMVLDIIGDIFILVIPVTLIWQIRIHWTQKLALVFTLCLTFIMIGITISRIAGLKWKDRLDSIWETFNMLISAEIGLALVAITTFRTLYISKVKRRRVQSPITTFNWYHKSKSVVARIFGKGAGKTRSSESDGFEMEGKHHRIKNEIPRGTMTGVQTFIEENGKSNMSFVTEPTV
ncbi:hypothetical protein K505DRAFT_368529 [Melanomma pulvis-pyrius CBS 109.77]|uniref:Rhodopsin domain-containing protein n=1 Tax=Melanomma pulvis-pyrius CBS 109.77 TaxID=1314802 RepID=A0A6A6WQ86_9PLEO|nr:hypothetical protein K505DRAFT_368529 [Melanomma pulvis-pyrius CBS 109.77]